MLDFGLNQITISEAPLGVFLDTAARLGCVGVELRNDLGRAMFDGKSAADTRKMLTVRGLRFLGLSQVYPFNRWTSETANNLRRLLETAGEAGAETISLIPCNDGTRTDATSREADLDEALAGALALLKEADMVALVEPLGFQRSSLRLKSELVAAIDRLGAWSHFKLVHDTFHHTLAAGGLFFAEQTGIVHISGVSDPTVPTDHMEDRHRVLVDAHDRLGNLNQITALLEAGYSGVFSIECFAPEVRGLAEPEDAIRKSIEFISSHTRRKAA